MALLRLLGIFIALLSAGAVRPDRFQQEPFVQGEQQEPFVQGGSNKEPCGEFDGFMYFKTIQDICTFGCLVGVLTLIVSCAILCCGFMKKYAKHMAGLNLLVGSLMFLLPYIASGIASKQVIDDACKHCECDVRVGSDVMSTTPRQTMQAAATALGIIAAYFQGGLFAFVIGWIDVLLSCCLFCVKAPKDDEDTDSDDESKPKKKKKGKEAHGEHGEYAEKGAGKGFQKGPA